MLLIHGICLPKMQHDFYLNNMGKICSKIDIGSGFKESCHCEDLIEFSGKIPFGRYLNGSVFDIKKATRFVNTEILTSKKSHEIIKKIKRSGYVPILVQQMNSWFYPPLISNLPCSSSRGEDAVILRTFFSDKNGKLINMKDATFLEVGAYDGITESNTWFFENCLNWNGILIEAQPKAFKEISRNRPLTLFKKNYGVCSKTKKINISDQGTASKISDRGKTIECLPISKIINETKKDRIDFFSLDVEGNEPEVISTLGKGISYGVVMIEVSEGQRRILSMKYMLSLNFLYIGQISSRPSRSNFVISDVFYNQSHMNIFFPDSRVSTYSL